MKALLGLLVLTISLIACGTSKKSDAQMNTHLVKKNYVFAFDLEEDASEDWNQFTALIQEKYDPSEYIFDYFSDLEYITANYESIAGIPDFLDEIKKQELGIIAVNVNEKFHFFGDHGLVFGDDKTIAEVFVEIESFMNKKY